MYRRFHDRFGTAGVLLGVIALVLALVTGAYAAGGGLSGKQKKEVEKIAKKYAGKPGAPGAAGTNGTNGTNGAAGKEGPEGKAGTNAEGASFVGEKTVGSVNCKEGGVEVKSAKPATAVCNGAKGKAGEPWSPNNTLPSAATETGAWVLSGQAKAPVNTAISFPVQLAAELDEEHVSGVTTTGEEISLFGGNHTPPLHCHGSAVAPQADEGYLCVYVGFKENIGPLVPFILQPQAPTSAFGAGVGGAVLSGEVLVAGEAIASGTWAVTAE